MDEVFAQCKFDLNNLKQQYEMLKNDWTYSEEQCHDLQAIILNHEQSSKKMQQDIEKLRDRECSLSQKLEATEEELQQLLKKETEFEKQSHKLKSLASKVSELQELVRELKAYKFDLQQSLNEATQYNIKQKRQLEEEQLKNSHMEAELLALKHQAEIDSHENEVLRETINEMREAKEADARERLEQSLLTPTNLFNEFSISNIRNSTSVRNDITSRRLDFSESSCEKCCSSQSLESELLFSKNSELKKELMLKTKQLNGWQKKWRILNARAHKYKMRLRRQKNQWKEQAADEESYLEESVVSVVVKDGVQSGQPRVRIIETVSIATQTESVAILAAAVQTHGTMEENLETDSLSESEEESSESRQELAAAFSEHRSFSADNFEMDMYRSCRKLSVLPEEDGDEGGLHRNSSVRSNLSARLCTSADDVTSSIRGPPGRTGKVVSCADILLSSKNTPSFSVSLSESDPPVIEPDTPSSSSSNEVRVSLLDPADAFRQPHSFDSYLDPQKIPQNLPRQISDPTQNTVCAPPLVRRGSYVKRPRSTCRPLTLTCIGKGDQVDGRVPKVRFDLTEKEADEPGSPKEIVLVSKLKPTRNVSRFRVEPVDENELYLNELEIRKRAPLIHSVVYKKSVLQDLSPPDDAERPMPQVAPVMDDVEVPEDSSYEPCVHGSYLMDDIYPCKRRKQSDVSCASLDESSDGADIFAKSIRLHQNSECIVMRDLSGDTSSDTDIPYIDAEELAEIMAEVSRTTQTDVSCFDTATYVMSPIGSTEGPEEDAYSPTSSSIGPDVFTSPSNSSSGTFCTAISELTPMTDDPPSKQTGLSKSPTVLKNLASFESYDSPDVKHRLLPKSVLEEDDELSEASDTITYVTVKSDPLHFSSDCESDTYVTVKSEYCTCSDGDSDTYVTLKSERSCLERKHSDLSEHSNSPYNTPPDTSSASFCTPPDTYSPLFMKASHYLRMQSGSRTPSPKDTRSSSPSRVTKIGQESNTSSFNYDTPPNVSPFASPCKGAVNLQDNETVNISNIIDAKCPVDKRQSVTTFASSSIIFDSPKLEFYEPNDSVENLEAFLESEEGLREDDLPVKRNSLDSATDGRFIEKRMKRHPPLSRQNSTEEYIYLEPQDSSLNLSEEISSPSTTPDTSNKTVIFKNKPLTVSNTIDLDDDDFPISESEIIINLNGSQSEIVEIPLMHTCKSEPCIPSMGKSTLARLSRQSCSMSEDPNTVNYPAIVISTVSSGSEESNSCRGRDSDQLEEPDDCNLSEVSTPPSSSSSTSSATAAPCPSRPPCPLPEASLVPQEGGSETQGHSDADSSDSGYKVISMEPDVANDSPEEVSTQQCPNKEMALPNLLEALKSLTDDEVETRAQQLALALQTDAQTLIRRLQLRQRHRDLAERNLEREIERMRSAMQSLQYLCIDCNSLDVLTKVRAQLECVLASAICVSSTAEAYGFVQSEERMAAAVAPLVRYVDTVANARLERPLQSPRSPFLSLEEPRDDERVMRRRSVASVPLSLESRRRASIPFLPRPPSPLLRNGSPSLPPSPTPVLELNRRDSALRQRRETRISDNAQMTEILESPERVSPPSTPCSTVLNTASQTLSDVIVEKPVELQLRFGPVCRTLLGVHVEYMQLVQFRWPTVSDQVVPFLLTWYLVLCCLIVFSIGVSMGRRSSAVT